MTAPAKPIGRGACPSAQWGSLFARVASTGWEQ